MRNLQIAVLFATLISIAPVAIAQKFEPLVLGVYDANNSHSENIIQPAVMFDGKKWVSLDEALSKNEGSNTGDSFTRGLPRFEFVQAYEDAASRKRVPLATLAALALGNKSINLKSWVRYKEDGKQDSLRGLNAMQTSWSCNSGWGVEIAVPTVKSANRTLVANQDVPVSYFMPQSSEALSASAWTQLKSQWNSAEPKAITEWVKSWGKDSPLVAKIKRRDVVPLKDIKIMRVQLPGEKRALISVTALKPYGKPDKIRPTCREPTSVFQALLAEEPGSEPTVLRLSAQVQDCGEGWSPSPRSHSWLVLHVSNVSYLAQWHYGLEHGSLGFYPLDAKTLLPSMNGGASGAGNGC